MAASRESNEIVFFVAWFTKFQVEKLTILSNPKFEKRNFANKKIAHDNFEEKSNSLFSSGAFPGSDPSETFSY